jgi:Ca-activated chloride channel family protein
LTLDGKVNGNPERYTYSADFKEGETHDFIPPLWASRNIGYLLDQLRLHGENKEVVDEIIRLAKQYGILTPYTSYLILEDEAVNLTRRNIPADRTIFNNRSMNDDEFRRSNASEFNKMKKESGEDGIQSSIEVQELNSATKMADTKQGSSRMGYVDKKGKNQNFSNQMKNVQGRAVYQNGEQWNDLYIQQKDIKNTQRIQFASADYFDLMNKYPATSQFLSLGKNVRFVYKDNM